jgi:hypothetical protein
MSKLSPFDFIDSICFSKKDIMQTPEDEKVYQSFIINRGLSLFNDTIFFANEMNIAHSLSNKMKYDFLRFGVRKKKRYSKWPKKSKNEDINLIKQSYGYNDRKAHEVLKLFSKEQLKFLKDELYQGGAKTK